MNLIRLSVILLFISVNGQAQQMTYLNNGKVSQYEKVIKRPRYLKKILQQQNSQELMKAYKKYIWRKRSAQLFSDIAGFGFIMSVEDEFGPNPKINWIFLGLGAVGAITAKSLHRPANKALKEIVEVYNDEIYYKSVGEN